MPVSGGKKLFDLPNIGWFHGLFLVSMEQLCPGKNLSGLQLGIVRWQQKERGWRLFLQRVGSIGADVSQRGSNVAGVIADVSRQIFSFFSRRPTVITPRGRFRNWTRRFTSSLLDLLLFPNLCISALLFLDLSAIFRSLESSLLLLASRPARLFDSLFAELPRRPFSRAVSVSAEEIICVHNIICNRPCFETPLRGLTRLLESFFSVSIFMGTFLCAITSILAPGSSISHFLIASVLQALDTVPDKRFA